MILWIIQQGSAKNRNRVQLGFGLLNEDNRKLEINPEMFEAGVRQYHLTMVNEYMHMLCWIIFHVLYMMLSF